MTEALEKVHLPQAFSAQAKSDRGQVKLNPGQVLAFNGDFTEKESELMIAFEASLLDLQRQFGPKAPRGQIEKGTGGWLLFRPTGGVIGTTAKYGNLAEFIGSLTTEAHQRLGLT